MNTYCAIVRLRREGLGSARTHTVTVVLDAVSPDDAVTQAEALALATIKSLPLLWRVEDSWLTDELVDARVTAELENARAQATADRAFQTDNTALRARVAELEKEAMILRGTVEAVTTQRQQAEQRNAELVEQLKAYGKYSGDTTQEDRIAELEKEVKFLSDLNDKTNEIALDVMRERDEAKQRGDELVKTMRKMRDAMRAEPAMQHTKYDALGVELNDLLARAESTTPAVVKDSLTTEPATPAKHPDTEIVDAIAEAGSHWTIDFLNDGVAVWVGNYITGKQIGRPTDFRSAIRAAIDAARKQGSKS